MGYDLEGKCKDIAARRKARGAKPGGSGGDIGSGGVNGGNDKGPGTGAKQGGATGRSAAPNYTSESVIVDIYGGGWAQGGGGAKERSTRASRRSASSVSYRLGVGEGRGVLFILWFPQSFGNLGIEKQIQPCFSLLVLCEQQKF